MIILHAQHAKILLVGSGKGTNELGCSSVPHGVQTCANGQTGSRYMQIHAKVPYSPLPLLPKPICQAVSIRNYKFATMTL
jgi:hypothetical protein